MNISKGSSEVQSKKLDSDNSTILKKNDKRQRVNQKTRETSFKDFESELKSGNVWACEQTSEASFKGFLMVQQVQTVDW